MDSIAEERIASFLQDKFHYRPEQCGAIVPRIRTLARVAGFGLDAQFGTAGLAAGPDARVAAGIANRALGGGGSVVSDFIMKSTLDRWLRTAPSRRR
ncbi:MAG: hypothetical protein V1790_04160 [Planctomycetota bacterium]